jgi:hypothetical protein
MGGAGLLLRGRALRLGCCEAIVARAEIKGPVDLEVAKNIAKFARSALGGLPTAPQSAPAPADAADADTAAAPPRAPSEESTCAAAETWFFPSAPPPAPAPAPQQQQQEPEQQQHPEVPVIVFDGSVLLRQVGWTRKHGRATAEQLAAAKALVAEHYLLFVKTPTLYVVLFERCSTCVKVTAAMQGRGGYDVPDRAPVAASVAATLDERVKAASSDPRTRAGAALYTAGLE